MSVSSTETISSVIRSWRLLSTDVSKHCILILMKNLWEWSSLLSLTATLIDLSNSADKIQSISTQTFLTMKAFTTTIWTCIKISTWTSLLNERQQFDVRRKSTLIVRKIFSRDALLIYSLTSLWLLTFLYLLLRQSRSEFIQIMFNSLYAHLISFNQMHSEILTCKTLIHLLSHNVVDSEDIKFTKWSWTVISCTWSR